MIASCALVCACSVGEAAPGTEKRFGDVVRIVREVDLQEPRGVINVSLRVTPDPFGGFLVTDSQEGQIRQYSPNGVLLNHFGRLGPGPGEFRHIAAAARLPSGNIIAADMEGVLTLFNESGSRVLRISRTPLGPLYSLAVLDDEQVVLTGRIGASVRSPLIHIWDLRAEKLVRSFFRGPTPPPGLEGAYAFAGSADLAVRGDTVAAVFALTDTIYLFRRDGTQVGEVPWTARHFRALTQPMPQRWEGPERFRKWTESFSAAGQLFWKSDGGGFYIAFFDVIGHEPVWRLVQVDRTGADLLEIPDAPQLLSISPRDSSLVFMRPGSDEPNLWSIAFIRR